MLTLMIRDAHDVHVQMRQTIGHGEDESQHPRHVYTGGGQVVKQRSEFMVIRDQPQLRDESLI